MNEHAATLVDWLRRRMPDEAVEVLETHISVVAFQGDRAYKLKKPVNFPFVDLSSAALREADCLREVELNRRFAPDVYLGVRAITNASGAVIDHVVEMRRLPHDRRLSKLAEPGGATTCVEALARDLAAVHASAPTGGDVDRAAGAAAIAQLWELGIEQLAPYEGLVVSSEFAQCVASAARRYIAGRAPLFAQRVAQHRARDGHGDLLADDVFCLDDGPRAIDCLEFDDRLRWGDGLADAAFLAMDLEHLRRADLATTFLESYRRAAHDDWPASLAHLYVAYRAHVRAKVACLRFSQGDDTALATARALLALAHTHLNDGRVRLVLVGGAPASGKTTVARGIAHETGWRVLRSDVVRKEFLGRERTHDPDAPLDTGPYAPSVTDETYSRLLELARDALDLGESVVVDASWSQSSHRTGAHTIARDSNSDLIELECTAPEDVRVRRAQHRAADAADASDAGPWLAKVLGARFEPWPDALRIDTTQPAAIVLDTAMRVLRAPRCEHTL